jgi:hypothetical protein
VLVPRVRAVAQAADDFMNQFWPELTDKASTGANINYRFNAITRIE